MNMNPELEASPEVDPILEKLYSEDEALTFVVFGATGDLARKKLYPAFGELLRFNRLPDHINIIGYGRSDYTMESLWKKQSVKVKGTEEEKEILFKCCSYFRGQYDSVEDFKKLNDIITEKAGDLPDNRVFFLSIPPTIFGDVCNAIKEALMSKSGFTRIILEKPFGRDTESFLKLNTITSTCFDERQIYRIDHYLGKEVIMNLMVQRFANVIFEPMWNHNYISSIEINWQEDLGTGGRGGYFDKFGIIRDIMQNHLLQVLMFVCMERPDSLSGPDIVKSKSELLRSMPEIKLDDCILGQFTSRKFLNHGEEKVEPGYLDDETVPEGSRCPTYAMIRLSIENERWQGVPIIMKAGKGLNERMCEVRIRFHPAKGLYEVPGNELVMRIQPDEAIYFKVQNKTPGLNDVASLETTVMDLSYRKSFQGVRIADAYERAFLNTTRGDQSLFVGSSELIEAWRIFTPVLTEIDEKKPHPLLYPFGTRGPEAAFDFLSSFGIEPMSSWESFFMSYAKESEELLSLFNEFAENNVIAASKVPELMKRFYDGREATEKRVDKFMSRLDMDDDGLIDWEEFQHGMTYLLNTSLPEDRIGVPTHCHGEDATN